MSKGRQTWTTVAEAILRESKHPLDSREIAKIAFERRMKNPSSGAPEYSVQAAIARDLKSGRKEASPFVVLGERPAPLKYWLRDKIKST